MEQEGYAVEGVTVLNVYSGMTAGWAVVLSFNIVFAVVFVCVGIYLISDGEKVNGIFLIVFAVCCVIGMCKFVPTTQFYEVALSDDVKFSKFTQHYDVQKVRGQILTVTEVKND